MNDLWSSPRILTEWLPEYFTREGCLEMHQGLLRTQLLMSAAKPCDLPEIPLRLTNPTLQVFIEGLGDLFPSMTMMFKKHENQNQNRQLSCRTCNQVFNEEHKARCFTCVDQLQYFYCSACFKETSCCKRGHPKTALPAAAVEDGVLRMDASFDGMISKLSATSMVLYTGEAEELHVTLLVRFPFYLDSFVEPLFQPLRVDGGGGAVAAEPYIIVPFYNRQEHFFSPYIYKAFLPVLITVSNAVICVRSNDVDPDVVFNNIRNKIDLFRDLLEQSKALLEKIEEHERDPQIFANDAEVLREYAMVVEYKQKSLALYQ
jgi:hypothetical protein